MRQRRWVEFLKGYNFELKYHARKANIVADALSRKSLHMSMMMVKEYELLEKFRNLNLSVEVQPTYLHVGLLKIESVLRDKIRQSQEKDEVLKLLKNQPDFQVNKDNIILFKGKICVLGDKELKDKILAEAHYSKYTIHPGATKMYQYLRKEF